MSTTMAGCSHQASRRMVAPKRRLTSVSGASAIAKISPHEGRSVKSEPAELLKPRLWAIVNTGDGCGSDRREEADPQGVAVEYPASRRPRLGNERQDDMRRFTRVEVPSGTSFPGNWPAHPSLRPRSCPTV